jgi:transcriptional regulator with XRE-family HTH domain
MAARQAQLFREVLVREQPEAIRFGQIWTTRPADDEPMAEEVQPRLVIVLADAPRRTQETDDTLPVAPVSLDLAYRSRDDLTITGEESPLGYAFMIEIWNEAAMLGQQLVRYVGVLPQPLKRYLGLLYQAHLGLGVSLAELEDRLGPAILHPADPRLAFQEEEIAACSYLRRPALERALVPVAVEPVPEIDGLTAAARRQGLSLLQLAGRLGLTPALVAKLDLRTYRYGSLGPRVVQALADALSLPFESVARYLQRPQTLAPGTAFFSEQAPEAREQEDFAQALRDDTRLTEEQRVHWLALTPGDPQADMPQ